MQKYLVLREREGFKAGLLYAGSSADEANTLEEAKLRAAKLADQRNEYHIVVELVGYMLPNYDPEAGWQDKRED